MKNTNKQLGFTLVEMLLYVAVLGTLVFGLSALFADSVDLRVKNKSISEVNDQGTFAMDYISQTIRNATAITSPAAGGTGSSLTLTVPTGALSPTVFNLSGTTLRVTEGVGSPVNLTGSGVQISALTVKNLTRSGTLGVVQVSFTVTSTNGTGRNPFDYSKTFVTSMAIR